MDEPDEDLDAGMRLSSKAIGSAEFCAWAEAKYHAETDRQGRPEDVAMRRQEGVTPPDAVQTAVVQQLQLASPERLCGRGNTFPRDLLIMAWRDLSGLSNREIGHRLGHADGATVGKRLRDLRGDSDAYQRVQTAIGKIRQCHIANCKA